MAGSRTLALTLSDRAQIVALTMVMAGLFWLSTHSTTVIAHVNGSVPGFVKLQSSPPGTQQTGNAYLSGMIRGSLFGGSGANLTSLNATNLVKGKINDSLLSSFVPLSFNNSFAGNGSLLTSLSAINLSTGTVPDARLLGGGDKSGSLSSASVISLRGQPTVNTTPQLGQVLRYNGSQWSPSEDSLSLPYYQTDGSGLSYEIESWNRSRGILGNSNRHC